MLLYVRVHLPHFGEDSDNSDCGISSDKANHLSSQAQFTPNDCCTDRSIGQRMHSLHSCVETRAIRVLSGPQSESITRLNYPDFWDRTAHSRRSCVKLRKQPMLRFRVLLDYSWALDITRLLISLEKDRTLRLLLAHSRVDRTGGSAVDVYASEH